MYLEIKDNNQSSFKWWLAPKLAKMKQDNYHIVRQANNIKDIIKETEALRRASIVYGVDITNSLALINNIKFPQNKHQSFSYNNSLTNSPTKIHHQTVYTKDKVSSKYKSPKISKNSNIRHTYAKSFKASESKTASSFNKFKGEILKLNKKHDSNTSKCLLQNNLNPSENKNVKENNSEYEFSLLKRNKFISPKSIFLSNQVKIRKHIKS